MKIQLAITLLISFLQGCKTEYRKIVETYLNGNPKIEHIYSDQRDTTNYTYNSYYENGKLMFSSKIIGNKFADEKRSYYDNGQVKRIEKLYKPAAFGDSLYDCQVLNYWKSGKLESRYTFQNSLLNGTAYYYDSLGRLGRSDEYVNGKLTGKEVHYFPNGKVKEIETVRNDSAYGFGYEFNENGDTIKAFAHYGLSVNGTFYKKWLSDNIILTGNYGDSNRSFVIWKWFDKNKKEIKRLVDKGNKGKFIAPE
jgi:antitoxin component YwqK of YwqJK toxin-antitoxin module